jgi:hypothetical protein
VLIWVIFWLDDVVGFEVVSDAVEVDFDANPLAVTWARG